MSEKSIPERTYDGSYYERVGDFQRETYLEEGFTKGTVQEVDFLVELLGLPAGARILDVGCGAGRHSLELARRGLRPVGVDISGGLVQVARDAASKERLDTTFQVADARRLTFEAEFGAAICLYQGAFGLAGGEEGHRRVLEGVSRALRPGAPFVLTAINALSVVRKQDPADGNFDPYTLTSRWRETVQNPEGTAQEFEFHCTAFSYRELKWLLEGAGLGVLAAYGCVAGRFERKPLTLEDVEIMVVAQRS